MTFAHIGNARPVIVFDVLFRLLRHLYGADACHLCPQHHRRRRQDQRARRRTRRADPRADRAHDLPELPRRRGGAGLPAADRRAARHRAYRGDEGDDRAPGRQSGNAYVAEDHVLFSVPSMPDYGKLSNRSLDEMIAGARVEVAPYKRDADGLRAVEAVEARRAVLAVAGGHRNAGPARLAHRMLGDVVEASRRDL